MSESLRWHGRLSPDNGTDQQARTNEPRSGQMMLRALLHPFVMRIIGSLIMFYVEIVKKATGEVVQRMGPMLERKADRVESGASINLNHDEYFTRIVSA
jgi:hypothetical protein